MQQVKPYIKRGIHIIQEALEVIDIFKGLYFNQKQPVIVYQMGKVASTSIQYSLKKQTQNPIFHAHYLNPANLEKVRKVYLNRKKNPPLYWHNKLLYEQVILPNKTTKTITLIREPIIRNISAFFQNIELFTGIQDFSESNINDLISQFLHQYDHLAPLIWFDKELKTVLGINVYDYPFPKEKGFLSICQGNFELLIIKSELSDVDKETAISDFLNIKEFKIIRKNVSKNKFYSQIYQKFVDNIVLPKDYVDRVCQSKYLNHFYTDEEIEKVRLKWTRD